MLTLSLFSVLSVAGVSALQLASFSNTKSKGEEKDWVFLSRLSPTIQDSSGQKDAMDINEPGGNFGGDGEDWVLVDEAEGLGGAGSSSGAKAGAVGEGGYASSSSNTAISALSASLINATIPVEQHYIAGTDNHSINQNNNSPVPGPRLRRNGPRRDSSKETSSSPQPGSDDVPENEHQRKWEWPTSRTNRRISAKSRKEQAANRTTKNNQSPPPETSHPPTDARDSSPPAFAFQQQKGNKPNKKSWKPVSKPYYPAGPLITSTATSTDVDRALNSHDQFLKFLGDFT